MGKGGTELQNITKYVISTYGRKHRISVRFLPFFMYRSVQRKYAAKAVHGRAASRGEERCVSVCMRWIYWTTQKM